MSTGGVKQAGNIIGEVKAVAKRLGWNLDDVISVTDPIVADDNIVKGVVKICKGMIGNNPKIIMENILQHDLEHRYFHRILIEGIPRVESSFNFTPDRGLQGTIGAIINAIPRIIKASPRVIEALDLPPCPTLAEYL